MCWWSMQQQELTYYTHSSEIAHGSTTWSDLQLSWLLSFRLLAKCKSFANLNLTKSTHIMLQHNQFPVVTVARVTLIAIHAVRNCWSWWYFCTLQIKFYTVKTTWDFAHLSVKLKTTTHFFGSCAFLKKIINSVIYFF